jgi:hypothetical protein
MLTDFKPVSLGSDDEAGVTFAVNISAKNVGPSPAQNVSVNAELFIVENAGPNPEAVMHEVCQRARNGGFTLGGPAIFPGQDENVNYGMASSFDILAEKVWAIRATRIQRAHDREIALNQPERAAMWTERLSQFPFYAPLYVAGCVNYFSPDNKLMFQTSFLYGLSAAEDGRIFPLLSGQPPVIRHPEPHPEDPEVIRVFPRQLQRHVNGEDIKLSRPLYPTFAR